MTQLSFNYSSEVIGQESLQLFPFCDYILGIEFNLLVSRGIFY